MGKQIFEGN